MDAVNIPSVVQGTLFTVFGILPLEGVFAFRDIIPKLMPRALSRLARHALAIDIKLTQIPVVFRGDFAIKPHLAITWDGHRDLYGRSRIVYAGIRRPHGEGTVKGLAVGNLPRIIRNGIVPVEKAEITRFEMIDELALPLNPDRLVADNSGIHLHRVFPPVGNLCKKVARHKAKPNHSNKSNVFHRFVILFV